MEENVVSAAGTVHHLDEVRIRRAIERFEVRHRPVTHDEFFLDFGYRPPALVRDGVQRKVKTPAGRDFQAADLLGLAHMHLAIRSEFAEE